VNSDGGFAFGAYPKPNFVDVAPVTVSVEDRSSAGPFRPPNGETSQGPESVPACVLQGAHPVPFDVSGLDHATEAAWRK
jgi:hypothetical protein